VTDDKGFIHKLQFSSQDPLFFLMFGLVSVVWSTQRSPCGLTIPLIPDTAGLLHNDHYPDTQ